MHNTPNTKPIQLRYNMHVTFYYIAIALFLSAHVAIASYSYIHSYLQLHMYMFNTDLILSQDSAIYSYTHSYLLILNYHMMSVNGFI